MQRAPTVRLEEQPYFPGAGIPLMGRLFGTQRRRLCCTGKTGPADDRIPTTDRATPRRTRAGRHAVRDHRARLRNGVPAGSGVRWHQLLEDRRRVQHQTRAGRRPRAWQRKRDQLRKGRVYRRRPCIPGHMLGLAPRPWEASAPTPAHHRTTEEDVNSVQRRRFLRAGSGAGLAVAIPELLRAGERSTHRPGPPGPAPTPYRTLASPGRRTRRRRHLPGLPGRVPGHQVAPPRPTSSIYRAGLPSVLAEQGQQAGWAAFDGGREADAPGLYEESHTAALEAGDNDLAGNALAFLAYQTVNGDRKAESRSPPGPARRSAPTLRPASAPCCTNVSRGRARSPDSPTRPSAL